MVEWTITPDCKSGAFGCVGSNPAPGTDKLLISPEYWIITPMNMPFKFQGQVIYEQLLIFSKDIFAFSGKLPTYETDGMILQLRHLTTTLLQDYAVGGTRASKVSFTQAVDNCITTIARITAMIDLTFSLGYIQKPLHQKLILTCEDLTKRLYESRKTEE